MKYLVLAWKYLRYTFWFVHVCSWQWWKYCFRHGPQVQIFRNRRYPKGGRQVQKWSGTRVFTHYRWGGALLGLEIGDRGHAREYVRKQLFGEKQ